MEINRDEKRLTDVSVSIVNLLDSVGVYKFNKLTYLFEYFFIKNFGQRYTKELFIKLPHGPVISAYKSFITSLYEKELIDTDITQLKSKKKFEDDIEITTCIISRNPGYVYIHENIVSGLLRQVVVKYAGLSVPELEKIVYQTVPVKKYLEDSFKKDIGGYVLDGGGIKMKDYNTTEINGRKLYLKHISKFPDYNPELHARLANEYEDMEKLRPAWDNS